MRYHGMRVYTASKDLCQATPCPVAPGSRVVLRSNQVRFIVKCNVKCQWIHLKCFCVYTPGSRLVDGPEVKAVLVRAGV